MRDRIIGLEYLDRSSIEDHPKNWRVHTPEQRAALDALLARVGVAGAASATPKRSCRSV